jgi:hypothetical protein
MAQCAFEQVKERSGSGAPTAQVVDVTGFFDSSILISGAPLLQSPEGDKAGT